ncbi:MAG: GUN4 domain-containing protein [Stigonema ocellatum SAG 48.90 = DSM 106950]|nr:GUN4 domain-containing protein [Stigonema ocellatum SAG 48.90 = DSM 106950]
MYDCSFSPYTNGRFGFSVQKKIYLCVGGVPDGSFNEEAWEFNEEAWELGDRVGWRVKQSWIKSLWIGKQSWIYYTEVTFDTKAPEGHLPIKGGNAFLLSHRDL